MSPWRWVTFLVALLKSAISVKGEEKGFTILLTSMLAFLMDVVMDRSQPSSTVRTSLMSMAVTDKIEDSSYRPRDATVSV